MQRHVLAFLKKNCGASSGLQMRFLVFASIQLSIVAKAKSEDY